MKYSIKSAPNSHHQLFSQPNYTYHMRLNTDTPLFLDWGQLSTIWLLEKLHANIIIELCFLVDTMGTNSPTIGGAEAHDQE